MVDCVARRGHGDKSGEWSASYPKAIAAADDLYDLYLAELGEEDLLPRE
jgi:hypothetical protein